MNRIATIDSDERVMVVSPDAPDVANSILSAPGHRCAWPVWSPDGEVAMYSAYPSAFSNGHGAFRLISARTGEAAKALYTNEPGTDAIAQHTPHYAMWAPDGKKVAFIAQTLSSGMSLMVGDADGETAPVRLLGGAPLYFTWSLDSEYILAHARELHYLIRLSEPEPAQVPVMSMRYQAPSMNPLDGRVVMCGEMSETVQGIIVATIQGGAEIVGEVEGLAAVSWRPGRGQLAVASGLDRGSGYYDRIALLDADSTAERVLIREPSLCFFWSPDGMKIAFITPSEEARGSVRWAVFDLETDDIKYLADFLPSHDQLTMFMFFDQYGQSHNLWSPDSSRLLFAGVPGILRERGPLADVSASSVYTVDVSGEAPPQLIGQGSIGVWSS